MKTRTCFVSVYVALGLAATLHAQADCADWNTRAFFRGHRGFRRDSLFAVRPGPASAKRIWQHGVPTVTEQNRTLRAALGTP